MHEAMVGFNGVFASLLFAGSLGAPADPLSIYGGDLVEPCAWPTTVYVQGCTGTLVHPQLVVFAAHCIVYGGTPNEVTFGEDPGDAAITVPTENCVADPQWSGTPGEGRDFAFCTLAESVDEVPIVPILMGCETQALASGVDVTLVGHGMADDGLPETLKRHVTTPITEIAGDEIAIGSDGRSGCFGDSGGPAYIQLDDGSWRVFGVTSYGESGQCGFDGWYSMLHVGIDWIEQSSGIDATPCHDADGTWAPTAACGSFPLMPEATGNSWRTSCAGSPLSGYSATCGEPFADDDGGTGESGSGGTAGSSSDGGESTVAGETSAASDAETGASAEGSDDDDDDGHGTSTGGAAAEGDGNGCACTTGHGPPVHLLALLAFVRLRRLG